MIGLVVEVLLEDWSKKPPKYLDADPCFIRAVQGSQNGLEISVEYTWARILSTWQILRKMEVY